MGEDLVARERITPVFLLHQGHQLIHVMASWTPACRTDLVGKGDKKQKPSKFCWAGRKTQPQTFLAFSKTCNSACGTLTVNRVAWSYCHAMCHTHTYTVPTHIHTLCRTHTYTVPHTYMQCAPHIHTLCPTHTHTVPRTYTHCAPHIRDRSLPCQ